jgi:hypothetical protein
MITFRLGGLKTGGRRTGVALRSETSQNAIEKLNELGLLALAIEPPPTKAIETSPGSPEVSAPEKTERFYSDGSRMQRWRLWLSSLPLSLVIGVGFYLLFTGAPQWIASVVMVAGFTVFSLTGFLLEQHRLKAFACPGCHTPIHDWNTNESHRILFNCTRCNSNWDIEYKLWAASAPSPYLAQHRRRLRRFSEFCMLRGMVIKPYPSRSAVRTTVASPGAFQFGAPRHSPARSSATAG